MHSCETERIESNVCFLGAGAMAVKAISPQYRNCLLPNAVGLLAGTERFIGSRMPFRHPRNHD